MFFWFISDECRYIVCHKALELEMQEIPCHKFEILSQELSTLLLHNEMFCIKNNMVIIPPRLFVGYHLYFLKKSQNFNGHWYFFAEEEGLLKVYCTNELFDKNILSNELRNFLIKNIDLFEGI